MKQLLFNSQSIYDLTIDYDLNNQHEAIINSAWSNYKLNMKQLAGNDLNFQL